MAVVAAEDSKLEAVPLLVAAELFFVVVVVRDSKVKAVVVVANPVSEFVPTDSAQFAAAAAVVVVVSQQVSE